MLRIEKEKVKFHFMEYQGTYSAVGVPYNLHCGIHCSTFVPHHGIHNSTLWNFGSTLWNFGSTLWNFGSTLWNFGSTLWNFGSTLWNFSSTLWNSMFHIMEFNVPHNFHIMESKFSTLWNFHVPHKFHIEAQFMFFFDGWSST